MRSLRYASVILLAGLAAAQTPARPKLPVHEMGEIDGARFQIDIPARWNGGLIMYAHGYTPFEIPFRLPGEEGARGTSGAILMDVANAQGYAIAQSAFSVAGFALREGTLETEALRHYFVRKYGKTDPTIIMGVHNGGLITYDIIERFPEAYNGAIAIGGIPMPKLEWCKERMFDMRVLFDYYFPGLPGSAVDFPDPVTWTSVREQAKKLVDRNPERAKPMLRMFNLRNTDELWRCMGLYTSILKDLNRNRAHGNAFDNRNTIYRGSDDDAKLNREIPRHKSDPKAVEYLRQWSSPSCRISSPVLAINSLMDPVVPSQDTHYYAEACERNGTSDLFVQMWIDSDLPLPGTENLTWTLRAMNDWIRNGKRPKPGEMVEKPGAQPPLQIPPVPR